MNPDIRKIEKSVFYLRRSLILFVSASILTLGMLFIPSPPIKTFVYWSVMAMIITAVLPLAVGWVVINKELKVMEAENAVIDEELDEYVTAFANSGTPFQQSAILLSFNAEDRAVLVTEMDKRGVNPFPFEPPPEWEEMIDTLMDQPSYAVAGFITSLPLEQRRFMLLQIPMFVHGKALGDVKDKLPVMTLEDVNGLIDIDELMSRFYVNKTYFGSSDEEIQQNIIRAFTAADDPNGALTLRERIEEKKKAYNDIKNGAKQYNNS